MHLRGGHINKKTKTKVPQLENVLYSTGLLNPNIETKLVLLYTRSIVHMDLKEKLIHSRSVHKCLKLVLLYTSLVVHMDEIVIPQGSVHKNDIIFHVYVHKFIFLKLIEN